MYSAITRPGDWWGGNVEGNAALEGSEFSSEFSSDAGERYMGMRVEEADDGKRVVWHVEPRGMENENPEWDNTSLIFDLQDDDSGQTKVNFTHRGLWPHDRGYEEAAETWRDRLAKGLQPLLDRLGRGGDGADASADEASADEAGGGTKSSDSSETPSDEPTGTITVD